VEALTFYFWNNLGCMKTDHLMEALALIYGSSLDAHPEQEQRPQEQKKKTNHK